ncbi:MAG TPA: hypothetical protein VGG83_10870 [Trebonia sp.]|jgi:hypothetical protein
MSTARIPVYRYRIDLAPPKPWLMPDGTLSEPQTLGRECRTVEAAAFRESEGCYIFDDVEGTVLMIRSHLVEAIERGGQVSAREVERS